MEIVNSQLLLAAGSWLDAAYWRSWLDGPFWLSVMMAAFGLGAVIFVHELGHFLVAKFCGVRCDKFYIGFDVPFGKLFQWMFGLQNEFKPFGIPIPSRFCRFQWGETEYGIGIVPLGGYVKMLGQDDNPSAAGAEAERATIVTESGERKLDPRSYPAKSVLARMSIISAGVIMNLIFAVIFATAAYFAGVPYNPVQIGAAETGGPAWQAGILPGDRIVQIGDGKRSDHLRHDLDLMEAVGMTGLNGDLDLVIRSADGSERTVTLRPVILSPQRSRGSLGVTFDSQLVLSSEDKWISHLPAANTKTKFQDGDKVVAVNGVAVKNSAEFQRQVAAHPDEAVTLSIERTPQAESKEKGESQKVEKLEIEVATAKNRSLGFAVVPGPIEVIQRGSPAETAGFLVGDELLKIGDTPVVDSEEVESLVRKHWGQEIAIEVRRKDGAGEETKVLKATPQPPQAIAAEGRGHGGFAGCNSLGIAWKLNPEVRSVVPGGPAEKGGLKPGDKLLSVRFLPAESKEKLENVTDKEIEIGKHVFWPAITNLVQYADLGASVEIRYDRQGVEGKVSLVPVEGTYNRIDRGWQFKQMTEIHTAEGWGEAISLGFRETKENAFKVLAMLRKLVTRDISVTNLGGPGTIAVVATSFASEGLPKLLIFLTMLSANLAVINFLPIPVLDGGHFLFLLAEGIRRKPLNAAWVEGLTLIGLVFVLGLMATVISLDVYRFSGLGR